ncbi:MAG: FHA domain-containing protein [Gemmatimonadota bacterium]|nr:FHA domain-containing protein [Gemmatimonadota bacterium]
MKSRADASAVYIVYELERRAYRLTDAAFTIGRGAENSIVIREPSVSRLHAELRPEGDEYVLHTSGATGTRVNGEVVAAPHQLSDGDRIDVGLVEFTFRRSKLPIGVSIVDPPALDGHDADILTRRETISNPILGGTFTPKQKTSIAPMLVVAILIAAGAAYFFLVMQ